MDADYYMTYTFIDFTEAKGKIKASWVREYNEKFGREKNDGMRCWEHEDLMYIVRLPKKCICDMDFFQIEAIENAILTVDSPTDPGTRRHDNIQKIIIKK